jgi:hypothetical protein
MIKLDLPSLQVRPSPPFRGKDAAIGQGLRAGAVMLLFLILVLSMWRSPARAHEAQSPATICAAQSGAGPCAPDLPAR